VFTTFSVIGRRPVTDVTDVLQSLSHCELITDDGIGMLSGSPCATEMLTILELDNCPLLTDTALNHLISCHSLQRIELYDCQLITRAGIQRLKVGFCHSRPAFTKHASCSFVFGAL